MELHGRYTFFGEGCRGSLTRQLEARFALREGADPQTYGIGIKEPWELDPAKHKTGTVLHNAGRPMSRTTWGGSSTYHLANTPASIASAPRPAYDKPPPPP